MINFLYAMSPHFRPFVYFGCFLTYSVVDVQLLPWPLESIYVSSLPFLITTQIAKFMEPTWAHLGPVGPRWAPYWPHEPCYYMNWLTYDFWTRTGGWEFHRSHGVVTSSPSHWQQVEEQAPKPVGWMMCFLLMTLFPVQKLCVNIYVNAFLIWVLL